MTGYAAMRAIDVYYARVDATAILAYADRRARAMIEGTVKATAHNDAVHKLPKLTLIIDGTRRIVERPPTLIKLSDMTHVLADSALRTYRETLQEDRRVLLDRYRLTDFALKVVGVGSVGPGPTWPSSSEAPMTTHCSSRRGRQRRPCTSGTSDLPGTAATASAWSRASAAFRRQATSSSARRSAIEVSTYTSGSCRTRRAARSSTR
jgi:hypothetical protein